MSKFGFNEVLKKVEQTKRELPKLLANQAQNYFVKSWSNQGFNNVKWKEVQRRIPETPEFKYPSTKGLSRRTKPILVGSGETRREVANFMRVISWDLIRGIIAVPYAEFLNEGTDKMPKRQFVGQTQELTDKQIKLIESHYLKVWD